MLLLEHTYYRLLYTYTYILYLLIIYYYIYVLIYNATKLTSILGVPPMMCEWSLNGYRFLHCTYVLAGQLFAHWIPTWAVMRCYNIITINTISRYILLV